MDNYYKPGTWNVMCAVCGVKFKSDEIRKRWDGLLVCREDYENRNILDFTRVKPEMGSVPYSNPEPADEFIPLVYITARYGAADFGGADFALADFALPPSFL